MINEKQNDLIYEVVKQIDNMVVERTGRDLPEFALNGWGNRLTKLCEDFAHAEHSEPKTHETTEARIQLLNLSDELELLAVPLRDPEALREIVQKLIRILLS